MTKQTKRNPRVDCQKCGFPCIWLKTWNGKNILVEDLPRHYKYDQIYDRNKMICHFETCGKPEEVRQKLIIEKMRNKPSDKGISTEQAMREQGGDDYNENLKPPEIESDSYADLDEYNSQNSDMFGDDKPF